MSEGEDIWRGRSHQLETGYEILTPVPLGGERESKGVTECTIKGATEYYICECVIVSTKEGAIHVILMTVSFVEHQRGYCWVSHKR